MQTDFIPFSKTSSNMLDFIFLLFTALLLGFSPILLSYRLVTNRLLF
ncbi:hypothetical protein CSC14_2127 [Proteus mirabilis]|nr:hypothetical protein CSC16_2516 [Proteus mirabilis]PVF72756.1 hypothetical protein CSC14_2127 [Proteus mirabilis]